MDFAKLYSLLDRASLFFCRANLMLDPWEGVLPKHQREPVLIRLGLEGHVIEGKLKADDADRVAGMIAESMSVSTRSMKHTCAVNCWHINEGESEALWKIYSEQGSGVAIKTRFRRLRNSFRNCATRHVMIGKMNYVDYEKVLIPTDNAFSPMMYKRLSFEHERELRAVIWELGKDPDDPAIGKEQFPSDSGEYVSVDLVELIESVFVSPASAPWFHETVKNLLKQYELNVACHQSALYDAP